MALARSDKSILSTWWWTIDRWQLATLTILLFSGAVFTMAATPMVAAHLNLDRFHFVYRHLAYMLPSATLLLLISFLSVRGVRRTALLLFLFSLLLMLLVPFLGVEVKGARRWISLTSFSLQPSEFAKPAFVVLTAWVFSEKHAIPSFPGNRLALGLCALFMSLLLMQPDLGMACVVFSVWFAQLFVNGLPVFFVLIVCVLAIFGFSSAYFLFPHVANRIDRFLDPELGDHYQIGKSLEAFSAGGLLGKGPGEGIVKRHLPDAHADFVFSVIGEEFGFVFCSFLVLLFAFIIIRGLITAFYEKNAFVSLALVGLFSEFGLQAFVNMASTLHLIPTKGMALPFISYGGSSMLATSLSMGMALALSRQRAPHEEGA